MKAYFCLKMIGDSPDAPHMAKARNAILAHGGAGQANVFTRILLAQFGQLAWAHVPTMPVEIILLPRWFPIHLSRMSYWARTVIVPLLVLAALRRRARNPREVGIQELFATASRSRAQLAPHQHRGWALFFNALDSVLKAVEPLWPKKMRRRAVDRCVGFVTERLNGEDGLGAIYPAMANSVMMFDALGYPADHPDSCHGPPLDRQAAGRPRRRGLLPALRFPGLGHGTRRARPCWKSRTAGRRDPRGGIARPRLAETLQELDVRGDWSERRPDVRPGGWAFQYRNAHYPDLDDTAVVVMAMDRARRGAPALVQATTRRSRAASNGSRACRAAMAAGRPSMPTMSITTSTTFRSPTMARCSIRRPPTSAPAASACWPSSARRRRVPSCVAGLDYLQREQMPDGSWFGRWGVNYIYGTWSALCALGAAGLDRTTPSVAKAADWLIAIQNEDGGWGEDCTSYKLDYRGYERARLHRLADRLGTARADGGGRGRPSRRRARHRLARQAPGRGRDCGGRMPTPAAAFPRVFYLRYHGYPAYFPLWALARYRNLRRANSRRVAWGM